MWNTNKNETEKWLDGKKRRKRKSVISPPREPIANISVLPPWLVLAKTCMYGGSFLKCFWVSDLLLIHLETNQFFWELSLTHSQRQTALMTKDFFPSSIIQMFDYVAFFKLIRSFWPRKSFTNNMNILQKETLEWQLRWWIQGVHYTTLPVLEYIWNLPL